MNRRPTRPIDPADAPEYEADLDAYHKAQDDAGDREKDDEGYEQFLKWFKAEKLEDNNETENDKDNE